MKHTILLALLLACGTAQAADWVPIGKADNGTQETFVDVSSIRVTGSIRRAWAKLVPAHHTMKLPDNDNRKKWVSYEVSREAFNCDEETSIFEALSAYFDDGTNGSVPADAFPTQWTPVPPDTIRSIEMHFVCAWKAQ
jgi:hypothetical protein